MCAELVVQEFTTRICTSNLNDNFVLDRHSCFVLHIYIESLILGRNKHNVSPAGSVLVEVNLVLCSTKTGNLGFAT